MNNLTNFIPKLAEFEFFPTGSRVYGCEKENSDWDYCFKEENKSQIFSWLSTQGIQAMGSDDYNNSIKFKLSPDPQQFLGTGIFNLCEFNFIFLDDANYSAWQKATEIMTEIVKFGSIEQTKLSRMNVFQSLVAYYGGHY